MFKHHLLFILILLCAIPALFAQKRNGAVYFNDVLGIDFINQSLLPPPTGVIKSLSSISDDKTGKFICYANNDGVYNADGTLMANGKLDSPGLVSAPFIVPNPSGPQAYYVFYFRGKNLFYANVDAQKGVVSKDSFLYADVHPTLQAVSFVRNIGWWVIAHSKTGNDFYAFRVLPNGIVKTPVVSTIGNSLDYQYFIYTSHTGDRLLVSSGDDGLSIPDVKRELSIFNFDKRCGSFTSYQVLYSAIVKFDYPWPVATFSPDDSKVFMSLDGNIIQYSGVNYSDSVTCFKIKGSIIRNSAVVYPGLDGFVYTLSVNSSWDGYDIYRISNPNKQFPMCGLQLWTSVNASSSQIGLSIPAQIINDSDSLRLSNPIDFSFDNACTGYKVQFSLSNDSMYDAVEWHFGDSSNPNFISRERNPVYTYKQGQDYQITLLGYICGYVDTIVKTITVREKVTVQLPASAIFCYKEQTELKAVVSGGDFVWSDGSTDSSLWVSKVGKYWLQAKTGDCTVTDTTIVTQASQVWAELGDEYFICDDDKELVKLDAGEKFTQYKWTPTGDTSQWIVVGDLGSYFVVVKDYRGCTGKDGTQVQRRCPVSVFYPNAFSPNNDGVNDVFIPVGTDVIEYTIHIYNSWGQQVFESNDLSKVWDGKVNGEHAPVGTYYYLSTYSGYRNKQMVSFETNGNITLLR